MANVPSKAIVPHNIVNNKVQFLSRSSVIDVQARGTTKNQVERTDPKSHKPNGIHFIRKMEPI
jgi:hypothetical protein